MGTTLRFHRLICWCCLVFAITLLTNSTLAADGEPVKISEPSVRDVLISPDSNWIVFGRDNALFSVAASGGTPIQLSKPASNGAIYLYLTRISPDSQRVIFPAREDANTPFLLFSTPIGGGTLVQLGGAPEAGEEIRQVTIPNDSSRVVFYSAADRPPGGHISSVPLDGSAPPVQLSQPLQGIQAVGTPLLSPDGKRVVYEFQEGDGEKQQTSLYSVPVGGGTPVMLQAPFPSYNYPRSIRLTPDSRLVVYNRRATLTARNELFSVATTGGQPQQIAVPSDYEQIDGLLFFVSGDSKRVAFAAYKERLPNLLSAPLDGGASVLIATNAGAYGAGIPFRITPDGQRVVYKVGARNEYNNPAAFLFSSPITGGDAVRLDTGTRGIDSYFFISPNGKRVVYTSYNMYSAPVDGSAAAVQINAPLTGLSSSTISPYATTFTPDGTSVLYLAKREDGDNDLVIASLFKQDARKLNGSVGTVGESVFSEFSVDFRLSPNGAFIAFRGAPTRYDPYSLYKLSIDAPTSTPTNTPIRPLTYKTYLPINLK